MKKKVYFSEKFGLTNKIKTRKTICVSNNTKIINLTKESFIDISKDYINNLSELYLSDSLTYIYLIDNPYFLNSDYYINMLIHSILSNENSYVSIYLMNIVLDHHNIDEYKNNICDDDLCELKEDILDLVTDNNKYFIKSNLDLYF